MSIKEGFEKDILFRDECSDVSFSAFCPGVGLYVNYHLLKDETSVINIISSASILWTSLGHNSISFPLKARENSALNLSNLRSLCLGDVSLLLLSPYMS